VGINRLKEIEFPLPPLETQQKIVAILEKAEETKKLRAQADELTQKLLQSVFLEMFGDPVKNLKKWGVEKVQDVISSIEAGWSANGEQRPREENEYAVLKVSAVTRGVFLPEECKVINNDIEFKKVVTPEKGDVLFSRANTLELVGASCLIREDYPYLLLPDKLWKIKVNKEKIYPEYLKFVLSYPTIRSEISKLSTGTSGSMYNISMNKLKLIGITVPPIEIQKNFSIIVETIEKTKEVQKQSSLEINNLFDALMQKAFTGELVS
jgi:type I restriction enzyme S subunit